MNTEFDLQVIADAELVPFFNEEERVLLRQYIDEGYISENKHPTEDLWIYNYTIHTQYNWFWNPITIRCRGLILDGDDCLVAKGFDKFFTMDQLEADKKAHLVPTDEPFRIGDKVDGSFGIMYFVDKDAYIATRGSFISDMAIKANSWLRDRYNHIIFDDDYSYRFEIIYPENRIVINYGKTEELVLLSIMDNRTGEERNIYDEEFDYIEKQGIRRVEMFDGYADWKKILEMFEGDRSKEGFVVHFLKSDFRVKMKLQWYKDASYIMQYFTKKSIWRMVRDGKDINVIIGDINDDEMIPRVQAFYDDLMNDYDMIVKEVTSTHHEFVEDYLKPKFGNDYTMKQFAVELKLYTVPKFYSWIIRLEKNKDIFDAIWRSIEPYGTDHIIL